MEFTTKPRRILHPNTINIMVMLIFLYEIFMFCGYLAGTHKQGSIATHLCTKHFEAYCNPNYQKPFVPAVHVDTKPKTPPSRYVFIFGDSYSSIEYNFTHKAQPTVENPFGNSQFKPETAYQDEKWIDTLYMQYPPQSTVVYNFATGGNLVNVSRMPEPFYFTENPRKDMIMQIKEFSQIKKRIIKWDSKNSIFFGWFGINDIDAIAVLADIELDEAKEIVKADVADYWRQIEILYKAGARNFIHIMPPPFDRAPLWTAAGRARVREMIDFWTVELVAGHAAFQKAKGRRVVSAIVDPAPIFHQVLDHPRNYGAPNATCHSKEAEDACLWRDTLHPGQAIHEQLGLSLWEISKTLGLP